MCITKNKIGKVFLLVRNLYYLCTCTYVTLLRHYPKNCVRRYGECWGFDKILLFPTRGVLENLTWEKFFTKKDKQTSHFPDRSKSSETALPPARLHSPVRFSPHAELTSRERCRSPPARQSSSCIYEYELKNIRFIRLVPNTNLN